MCLESYSELLRRFPHRYARPVCFQTPEADGSGREGLGGGGEVEKPGEGDQSSRMAQKCSRLERGPGSSSGGKEVGSLGYLELESGGEWTGKTVMAWAVVGWWGQVIPEAGARSLVSAGSVGG